MQANILLTSLIAMIEFDDVQELVFLLHAHCVNLYDVVEAVHEPIACSTCLCRGSIHTHTAAPPQMDGWFK